MTIRRALPAEVPLLARHRRAMFEEMGYRDIPALDAMCTAFEPWLAGRMASGEYVALVVEDAPGGIVAGAGVWFMDWPPHMIGPGAPRANIVNVYTEPAWRRQGLARRLMEAALAECRNRGVRAVILHASDAGRPLYESLGFDATNEMRLLL